MTTVTRGEGSTVFPVFRSKRFSLYVCSIWFPGYQITRTYILHPRWEVMVFIIPGLAFKFGIG